jgi:hypothetical protein
MRTGDCCSWVWTCVFVFELEGKFIRRGGRGIERKGRRRRRAARVSRELVPSLRLARFLFLLLQVLGI